MPIRVLAGTVALVAVIVFAGLYAAAPEGGTEEDAEAASWQKAPAMSQRRSYAAAAQWAGHIYVAGGMVGESGRHLAVFQRFDPTSGTWATLPRLPEPVRAGAGAALDGHVYVIGGTTPDGGGRQVFA
jgi:N-acetylneuraminic acid mutarotase